MPPSIIISGAQPLVLPAYYCEFSFTNDSGTNGGSSYFGVWSGAFSEGGHIGSTPESVGYQWGGNIRINQVDDGGYAEFTTAKRLGVAVREYPPVGYSATPPDRKILVDFYVDGAYQTTKDMTTAFDTPIRFAASVVTNDAPVRTITLHPSTASWLHAIPSDVQDVYYEDRIVASYTRTAVDESMTFVDEGNAVLTNGNLTLNEGASVHTPARTSVDIPF
jgi:hypothetical protein